MTKLLTILVLATALPACTHKHPETPVEKERRQAALAAYYLNR